MVDRGRPATEPERLLRSAAAALMLGDVGAARRAGARALASARTLGTAALEPRALEYLAYAELRAGRHQLARTHAEEGLRAARRAGQRNTAAHHHAVLALAASIEGARARVTEHATAALTTARRHGLAQAALLAQWAAARADLGEGRPEEAADRLGPLVRPGARRGHFAVWMLAVPCFVEAAALAGRPEDARAVVEDFALWAGCGADPQAPAQLLRCPRSAGRTGGSRRAVPGAPWTGTTRRPETSNGPVPNCCTGSGCAAGADCARPAHGSGRRWSTSNAAARSSGHARRPRNSAQAVRRRAGRGPAWLAGTERGTCPC
ncbi:hypothetical protein SHIRM173S_02369 [Streptomyces hirsutus]